MDVTKIFEAVRDHVGMREAIAVESALRVAQERWLGADTKKFGVIAADTIQLAYFADERHRACPCQETGFDGTQAHNNPSEEVLEVAGSRGKAVIPCMNHLGNYKRSPSFIRVK